MASKEINHIVELLMARVDKDVRSTLPKEFEMEVPHLPEGATVDETWVYRLVVLDFVSSGTTWRRVMEQFEASTQLNIRQYPEIRIKVHEDYVFLVGVEFKEKKPAV